MEKEAKQIIDLKRNLFKIDVRAQKDEEKVFMRTAWDKTRLLYKKYW
ncbi:exfoliative toxin [Streptococcus agalactiae]|nr:exfoliative toxin [Streptococcus agalactiae]KAF1119606.1 exfoliative toxin [Streptococcus agalactiae]KAF1122111.1 exfoliative toxin [Streptococcus agalactiae]KAF1140595.1 exfoliative toxin [Streptococcus agalactiae]KAF1153756.1 exfoliative toxin [Streptococcus agalactiae]